MLNRNRTLVVLASTCILLSLGACKTEIDDKTAAEVGEPIQIEEPELEVVTIDVIHDQSRIDWVGAKVTGQHDGGFESFDGSIAFAGNEPRKIEFTIDMSSIWSDSDRLTGHLKTPDFFDVENHPTARFESTSIVPRDGSPSEYEITGNLEMRGKTNSVTFPASVDTAGESIDATAEFTIDRQLWDVSYKGAPDNLIRDEVLVRLDLAFPKPEIEFPDSSSGYVAADRNSASAESEI